MMRELVGWLSADIPELHDVEIPRLAKSLERFIETRPWPVPSDEAVRLTREFLADYTKPRLNGTTEPIAVEPPDLRAIGVLTVAFDWLLRRRDVHMANPTGLLQRGRGGTDHR